MKKLVALYRPKNGGGTENLSDGLCRGEPYECIRGRNSEGNILGSESLLCEGAYYNHLAEVLYFLHCRLDEDLPTHHGKTSYLLRSMTNANFFRSDEFISIASRISGEGNFFLLGPHFSRRGCQCDNQRVVFDCFMQKPQ